MNMHGYEVGQKVFIKTFGEYYTGEVVEVNANDLVINQAAWIADTGRFANAMRTGEFSEIEPYTDEMEVPIPLSAIQSGVRNWPHDLPREQK